MSSHAPSEEAKASTTPSTSHPVQSDSILPTTAILVPLLLLLWRSGPFNILLVIASTTVLLLSPWIRLLLCLPTSMSDKPSMAAWDPARFLPLVGPAPPPPATSLSDAGASQKGRVRPRAKRPNRMNDSLRRPLDELTELAVRDFVCSWYNGQTLAHPSFPRTAHFTIDEMVDSVHARVSSSTRSVDIASELLHTLTSVMYTVLKARRTVPPEIPSQGIYSTSTERTDRLRIAVEHFFERHLPREERSSSLVRELLREIATRKLWDVIGACGDPDFINRKIVEWGDKQQEKQIAHPGSVAAPYSGPRTPSLDVDPVLLGQARAEAQLEASAAPQAGELASQDEVIPAPDAPAALPTAQRAALQASEQMSDSMRAAINPAAGDSVSLKPSLMAPSPSPSLTTQQPRPQMGIMAPPISPGPQTQQPRAKAMPSPSVRSFIEAEHQNATHASAAPSPTAGMYMASPSTSSLRGQAHSPAPSSDQVRCSGEQGRSLDALPESPSYHPRSRTTSHIGTQPARAPLMGPPPLPNRKPHADSSRPKVQDENWTPPIDHAMPSNIPSSVHEPDLPASLRDSLTSEGQRDSRSVTSGDSASGAGDATSSNDAYVGGYRIADESILEQRDHESRSEEAKETHEASLDSEASQIRPVLPPRPADKFSESQTSPTKSGAPMPRAPPLAQVLTRSDSDKLARLRDAFESWLDRGGTTAASAPAGARVQPGEGEALLRLHIGLATVARLVPTDSEQGELFRPDASSILTKAREALSSANSTGEVKQVLDDAVRRLELGEQEGGVREVLAPVERALWARLTALYTAFWQDTQAAARQRAEGNEAAASSSSAPGHARTLSYEPRKKPAPAVSASAAHSEAASALPARVASPAQAAGGAISRGSLEDTEPLRSRPSSVDLKRSSTSSSVAPYGSNQLGVTVTDVSPNAERPNVTVDPRTLELMIAVEGLANDAGGFVFIRRWSEFETLEKELRRTLTMPSNPISYETSGAAGASEAFSLLDGPSKLPPPPVELPKARKCTSAVIGPAVERYLIGLLSSPDHVASAPVRSFIDKTKAGAPAIGDGVRDGLAGPTGTAQRPTPLTTHDAKRFQDTLAPPDTPTLRRSASEEEAAAELRAMTAKTRAAQEQQLQDAGPQAPVSELSQRDLDALLAGVFAVADEAFHLSGGWTLRRGMLRVLEQVVRANYASSIMGAFNSMAAALSTDALGGWVDQAREKFWPAPEGKFTLPYEERTPEMRAATARRAKEIVVVFAPAQAGYVLGPGGRLSCEKALARVHEELTSPIVALDLALSLTLRILDIAVR
ncbi:SORTING NEXIN-13 [Ceraceosorus bombacis]|uniref:SORTING NEXIN-13 n=1 Tax=Ceraceosorus bombacis TaxID=401625 RepID=A0A0P1BEF0_9BASI|nr:SORTING NEXIN-13 [Ceraceosorus bombacis]